MNYIVIYVVSFQISFDPKFKSSIVYQDRDISEYGKFKFVGSECLVLLTYLLNAAWEIW